MDSAVWIAKSVSKSFIIIATWEKVLSTTALENYNDKIPNALFSYVLKRRMCEGRAALVTYYLLYFRSRSESEVTKT